MHSLGHSYMVLMNTQSCMFVRAVQKSLYCTCDLFFWFGMQICLFYIDRFGQ